jgi:hypothetical protein
MYASGAVTFRADLSGVVMQTSDWESGLIATRVCPIVNVDTKDGQYPVFDKTRAQLLKRATNLRRANSAAYSRGTASWSEDTYATFEYGHEIPIDYNTVKDMGRFFSVESVTSMLAKRKILLDQEIRVATATFNTTNYGSATNSGTAYTIANIATFDLALDVELAKARLRAKGESDANVSVVLSNDVFIRAKASTKLQNRLHGIGVSSDTILNVDEAAVAEAIGAKEVLVGKNYYDSAGENVTFSGSAIWNNTYVWVGRLGTGGAPESILTGGAQFTLNWSQYGPPLGVFSYEEPQTNSRVIRAAQHVVEKVTNANQGDLIATQYS